jgi:hypothetical protein
MKKNIKYILFIFTLALTLLHVSCTDENKFTNPVTYGLEKGAFATFVGEIPLAAYPDPLKINFSDQVSDANNTMSSYKVTMIAKLSGNEKVVDNYFETTSFPANFSFTSQSIADALDIQTSDISFGDTFNFIATATRNDGTIFTGIAPSYDDDTKIVSGGNTEGTLQAATYKSAMQFNFIVACPFFQEDIIGTYTIINAGGFYAPGGGTSGAGETFEIIAGPTADEIILVNPFASSGNYDLTIKVSEFGLATFDWQFAFETSEVCCDGYTATQLRSDAGSTSLALGCIGYIELKFNTRLGLAGGSPSGYGFGNGSFTAQKN